MSAPVPHHGESVLVKALDFTSKGNDDEVEVKIGDKKIMVQKKHLELNEAGVYNSETDILNNPGSGENKPTEVVTFINIVVDKARIIGDQLLELKEMIQENGHISVESVDNCIAEISSYIKSLEEESAVGNEAGVNKTD